MHMMVKKDNSLFRGQKGTFGYIYNKKFKKQNISMTILIITVPNTDINLVK